MDYGPQLVYPFRSRPAAANACAAGYTILPTSHSCASRALRLLAKRSRVAWRAHESGRVVAHCYLGLHLHLRSHAAMEAASLLREALWSFVSVHHLDRPGVDYAAYGRENIARFDAALSAWHERFGK